MVECFKYGLIDHPGRSNENSSTDNVDHVSPAQKLSGGDDYQQVEQVAQQLLRYFGKEHAAFGHCPKILPEVKLTCFRPMSLAEEIFKTAQCNDYHIVISNQSQSDVMYVM